MKNIIDSDMERMRERSEDPIPTEMTAEEKELDQKFTEILELLNEGVHEPAGSGCGFGFDADYQADAFEVFKKAIKDHTLSIIEKAVGETSKEVRLGTFRKEETADRILSRVKQELGVE